MSAIKRSRPQAAEKNKRTGTAPRARFFMEAAQA